MDTHNSDNQVEQKDAGSTARRTRRACRLWFLVALAFLAGSIVGGLLGTPTYDGGRVLLVELTKATLSWPVATVLLLWLILHRYDKSIGELILRITELKVGATTLSVQLPLPPSETDAIEGTEATSEAAAGQPEGGEPRSATTSPAREARERASAPGTVETIPERRDTETWHFLYANRVLTESAQMALDVLIERSPVSWPDFEKYARAGGWGTRVTLAGSIRDVLEQLGMIERDGDMYSATPLGRSYSTWKWRTPVDPTHFVPRETYLGGTAARPPRR